MNEYLEKLLLDSDGLTNDNKKMSKFFNNSSMSRLLDVFLDNPNLKMNIMNVLDVAGLSRKAIQVNIPLLLENDMIIEEQYKIYKFYKLNTNNSLVKQISQFRNILLVNNVFIPKIPATRKKKQNRRVNTKLQKNRSPRKSKKISR
jgi:hypothetical protein